MHQLVKTLASFLVVAAGEFQANNNTYDIQSELESHSIENPAVASDFVKCDDGEAGLSRELRTILQDIDSVVYQWTEYEIDEDTSCINLALPISRMLSAEESALLINASRAHASGLRHTGAEIASRIRAPESTNPKQSPIKYSVQSNQNTPLCGPTAFVFPDAAREAVFWKNGSYKLKVLADSNETQCEISLPCRNPCQLSCDPRGLIFRFSNGLPWWIAVSGRPDALSLEIEYQNVLIHESAFQPTKTVDGCAIFSASNTIEYN